MRSNSGLVCKKAVRAFAALEYIMLIMIIAAAFFTFRVYVQRAMQGQFRKAGEGFGYLRQFNPKSSLDCTYGYSPILGVEIYYPTACFNNEVIKLGCKKKDNTLQVQSGLTNYQICISMAISHCTGTSACNM